MKCKCNDITHESLGTTVWHRAYCNWYDSSEVGHRIRAMLWGRAADRLARYATRA